MENAPQPYTLYTLLLPMLLYPYRSGDIYARSVGHCKKAVSYVIDSKVYRNAAKLAPIESTR